LDLFTQNKLKAYLSNNHEYILKLWQTPILEFHCCECFRNLKKNELEEIEKILESRNCEFCKKAIDLYKFIKINND